METVIANNAASEELKPDTHQMRRDVWRDAFPNEFKRLFVGKLHSVVVCFLPIGSPVAIAR